jgi:hypothetical protein
MSNDLPRAEPELRSSSLTSSPRLTLLILGVYGLATVIPRLTCVFRLTGENPLLSGYLCNKDLLPPSFPGVKKKKQ